MVLPALLAVGLIAQFALPSARPAPGTAGPVAPPAATPPAGVTPGYPQILARPLFSPTRSPVAGGAPAGAQLSDFSLVGTAIARGLRMAFLRGPDGKTQTLHVGEQLLDWRLVDIRRDRIVVQAQGRQREIPVSAGPAATAAPLIAGFR